LDAPCKLLFFHHCCAKLLVVAQPAGGSSKLEASLSRGDRDRGRQQPLKCPSALHHVGLQRAAEIVKYLLDLSEVLGYIEVFGRELEPVQMFEFGLEITALRLTVADALDDGAGSCARSDSADEPLNLLRQLRDLGRDLLALRLQCLWRGLGF